MSFFTDIVIFLLITTLCYFVFFHHLGEFTLRMWDEARNGINALEMLENKNFLVTYFRGSPDLWNTKPPLFIWIAAFFFKMFGVSELTLRLPSAIAAIAATLAIFFFSKQVLRNRWVGVLGSLILLSSMGFSDTHIARTGDYDALLTLLVFLGSIVFFSYTVTWKNKYLYWSGLLFTLAVLTKGVAGLFMLPGMFFYLLLSGKLKKIIDQPSFWRVIGGAILPVALYYGGRELINSGYLKAVWMEEFLGRYKEARGVTKEGFWYYWRYLSEFRFQKWVFILPFSFLSYFLTKDKLLKSWVIFSFLLVSFYFLIISGAGTKQIWYDAQLYPLASILVALFIVLLINRFPLLIRIIPVLILCFYLQRYVRTNLAYIHRGDLLRSSSCIKYGYLFRDKSLDKSGFVLLHKDQAYCMPFYFYAEQNGLEVGQIEGIKTGARVLTCDGPTINAIETKALVEKIFDNKDGCQGFIVKKLKI